jgi:arylsulfatase A-like enzyme
MNVVLLVVDSLRARSLDARQEGRPDTPFLDALAREAVCFRRAFATECWTLPAHASVFTGLLPSEHGAHFQHMGYDGAAPTLAEELAAAGFHTEVVTRNSIFDGSLPGITRGFIRNTQILSPLGSGLHPLAFFLALSKPRFRRQIQSSGFFGALQRERRDFVMTFARSILPADRHVLEHVLARMTTLRTAERPYFIFANLYDVHAPYSPSPDSMFRPVRSFAALWENLTAPVVLRHLGSHAYLRPGFRLGPRSQRTLLARYHRAIELMDVKLADFFAAATTAGVLDDTLVVVTSDHGEAFGDHDLYFHDASVYDTHLRVPLWIHHPDRAPAVVDDVVSTRDLCGLIRAAGLGHDLGGTLLASDHRSAHPVALAEHFHYPHTDGLLDRYKQNLTAAVVGTRKVIVRREGLEHYDLGPDPLEAAPAGGTIADFEAACRRDGLPASAIAAAGAHLRRSSVASDRAQTRAPSRRSPQDQPTDGRPLASSLVARGPG